MARADGIRTAGCAVMDSVEKVIVGKRDVVRLLLAALLADGHVLVEDVPGVGKTMMARAMAASLGCSFRRIQFTPDLLPQDVTGMSVFNQKTSEFEYRPGPIMANILLADEINRATPRTQSSLLEAMEERQVTVDGVTYRLKRPFLVVATQNPVEYEGTFPLPEAQLDRFMLRIRIGYPEAADEMDMLSRITHGHPIERVEPILDTSQVARLQEAARDVYVEDSLRGYIVRVVASTRTHPDVMLGASPRGSIALLKSAQALAALDGRDFVTPDDIKTLATFALTHRLVLKPESRLRGTAPEEVVEDIVRSVPVPVEGPA
ncbi:MAG: AAA family ATPase [Bacteroidota bacterium]